MDIETVKAKARGGYLILSAHADQEAADENIDIAEINDAILNSVYPETTQVRRFPDSKEVSMNETRCHICGGTDFEERRVEYVYRRARHYLVVRDVPCEVCLRCGVCCVGFGCAPWRVRGF